MAESRKKLAGNPGYGVKAALLRLGSEPIDGRTRLGRALEELQADLTASLGGELSKQQELLVATLTRSWLLLESLDRFILGLECPVNRKRRAAYPIVEQRSRLADSVVRQLMALGLQRTPKAVGTIQDFIREHDQTKRHSGDDCEPPEVNANDAEPTEIAELERGARA